MANISFIIPDAKLQRVLDAIAGVYPIPKNLDGTEQFTKAQWGREYLRRLVMRTVFAWEREIAEGAVTPDDGIIS